MNARLNKEQNMIKPTFGFVVEYVPDIQAAKRFYIDVLGLDVERDHPTFVQFRHFAIANDESLSGSRDPEVYWLVEDAAAAFTELSQRADITLRLTERPYGKVFGIAEPSGRQRYLLELARERPSRPVQ